MTEVLKRIAAWKNAAENEPLDDQYFYAPAWLERVISGECPIVLGRKGMGKTAIAQHLAAESDTGARATTLTLETLDLPASSKTANLLSDRANLIKAWKYIILRAVCELFLESAEGRNADTQSLARTLGVSVGPQRGASIAERLRRVKVDVGFFGLEVGMKEADHAETPLEAKIQAMQDFIESNIFTAAYRIVFDALDKGWIEACEDKKQGDYLRLITALISAAIDITNYFQQMDLPRKIYPIIFIRSDIFSQIGNAQRAAWEDDRSIRLHWSPKDLKAFARHRILKTARIVDYKIDEKAALSQTFQSQTAELFDLRGAERRINFVDYLIEFSLGRPRDVVMYLKAAAQAVISKPNYNGTQKINKNVLVSCQKDYGRFLRREIHDELGGEYPGIARLMNGLQAGGRDVVSFEEFCHTAKDRLGIASDNELMLLAERLFELSFFGHVLPDGKRLFPVHDEIDFDMLLPLAIHPCYAAAMNMAARKVKA